MEESVERAEESPSEGDRAPGDRGEFVFLGTGTSVGVPTATCDCRVCEAAASGERPRWTRLRCSAFVSVGGKNILIDTSPDLRQQVLRERINRIDAVLYTHAHVDHLFGLDDLRVFCFRRGGPMPLFCEPFVEECVRKSFHYAFDPAVRAKPSGGLPELEFRRLDRPVTLVEDVPVVPIPLKHGRTDVTGFRIGDLAYCTDVNHIPESSYPLLEGLETFIVDALRPQFHPTHFSLDEALAEVERIGPRRAILTHIACQMPPEATEAMLPEHVSLAYDGLRVPFRATQPVLAG